LKNVTVSWAAPQSIYFDLHLFESVNIAGATLNVPVGTKALYQAHELWGQFGTITEGGGTDGISGISDEASPEVTISDRILTVSSPAAEQIEIYSFTGAMLYNAVKASGEATFNLTNLPKGALIVRGSSGWTQKIIRK
jgi:hypothetical protein